MVFAQSTFGTLPGTGGSSTGGRGFSTGLGTLPGGSGGLGTLPGGHIGKGKGAGGKSGLGTLPGGTWALPGTGAVLGAAGSPLTINGVTSVAIGGAPTATLRPKLGLLPGRGGHPITTTVGGGGLPQAALGTLPGGTIGKTTLGTLPGSKIVSTQMGGVHGAATLPITGVRVNLITSHVAPLIGGLLSSVSNMFGHSPQSLNNTFGQ